MTAKIVKTDAREKMDTTFSEKNKDKYMILTHYRILSMSIGTCKVEYFQNILQCIKIAYCSCKKVVKY